MPYRAVEIANEFLKLPGAASRLTQMKLQKLVYIAHGWNTAINDTSLVSDRAEAWTYGPVYRDLYDHTKFFGRDPIGRLITPDDNEMVRFFAQQKRSLRPAYSASLTDAEKQVIAHVWGRYGALPAARLVELTHTPDTPWFEAYRRGQNSALDEDVIKQHYRDLANRIVDRAQPTTQSAA